MRRRIDKRALLGALAAAVALLAPSTPATAAELSFPFSARVPQDGAAGAGAGRLDGGRSIAFNPANKHVYVAETANHRISEFTAWGEFVKAIGWGVRDGSDEQQTCTAATGCLKGLTGSGPGQFGTNPTKGGYTGPLGLAIDSSGDLYTLDLGNFRIHKFDSDGNFLLSFGAEGSGDGEFSIENVGAVGDYLGVAPDDTLYVGDKDRIQAFEPDGSFKQSLPLPEPGNPGALDVGPDGTVYFAYVQGVHPHERPPNVYRFTAAGEQITPPLEALNPTAVAVAPNGNVYVGDGPSIPYNVPAGPRIHRVVAFSPLGEKLGEFGELSSSLLQMHGLAVGSVGQSDEDFDVYATEYGQLESLSAFRAHGAVPDPAVVGLPPLAPPAIAEQFAASVGVDRATVRAGINPRFWTDTRYYVEYGTAECETEPCRSRPVPPGALLTAKVTSEPVLSPGAVLSGLEPGTVYHYRFVAESSGGGPVVGPYRSFRTAAASPPVGACPNDPFRVGAGAFLPDCRAYEMVSPVEKGSADIVVLADSLGFPAGLHQSARVGDKITYSAAKAFGDAKFAPYTSQYMAQRDPLAGWRSRSISPPRRGPTLSPSSEGGLNSQFKQFDDDLCRAWLIQDTDLSLAPGSVPGYANLYEADLCGGARYEAITIAEPAAQPPPLEYAFGIQGTGGGHSVFRANDSLIDGVAPLGNRSKVYDYFEGGLTYVCVRPDGTAVSSGCAVGGPVFGVDRYAQVTNAVSDDGSRIYWTAETDYPGRLYLRQNATETIAVSKGDSALFWGASSDGSRAIFGEGGTLAPDILYAFEPEQDLPGNPTPIAAGVLGVAGMSEDARIVYFVSTEALAGGAPEGEPNLYRHEQGSGFELVATLSHGDVSGSHVSPIHERFARRLARVTPDGDALAFISNNGLTGQDSVDLRSGKPLTQVYLYRADTDTLTCASCNETRARPVGRDILRGDSEEFWAAGLLPPPATHLYYPRVLSDDGERVYFNSYDALVQRDTNGAMDVYQWAAQGNGDCTDPGGCLSLISSGESPQDSTFVDASAAGTDVFFTTGQSFVAQDNGLIDIYDARVGGGFPPPPSPPLECEGEACQSPAPPPTDATPSSASFMGPGNQAAPRKAKKAKRKKARAKQRGKKQGKGKRKGKARARGRSLRGMNR